MEDVTVTGAPAAELARWMGRYAHAAVPVCARTGRELGALAGRLDSITPRDIWRVVQKDPLFALHVLRLLERRRGPRQQTEITTVERGVMMIGVGPFFAAFRGLPTVEALLAGRPQALAGFGRVLARARLAARFSHLWAQLRLDIEAGEIVVAALLHELAELLLWCFDSEAAERIAATLRAEPGLRSAEAQQRVLGYRLHELQLELARTWTLPGLLVELMDHAHAHGPRVRSVALATALARHAVNGWRDPALRDDYRSVAQLLRLPEREVRQRVRAVALEALVEQERAEEYERALAFPAVEAPGAAGELEVMGDAAAVQRACASPHAGKDARLVSLLACAATVLAVLAGTRAARRAAFVTIDGDVVTCYEPECIPRRLALDGAETAILRDIARRPAGWVAVGVPGVPLPAALRTFFPEATLALLSLPAAWEGVAGCFVAAVAAADDPRLARLPGWIAAGLAGAGE